MNDPGNGTIFQREPSPSGWRRRSWWAFGTALTALTVAVLVLRQPTEAELPGRYLTEEIASGNLVVTISANGTLQPTRSVDVGSELSGILEAVLVEENDRVKQGQILARLDTAKLQDQVTRSRAAVAAAEANVEQAQATVVEARAKLSRLQRIGAIRNGSMLAEADLESAQATYTRAVANVTSAKAAVSQARATLKTDETNIAKGAIRTPISGVVLTRKVEPGQTVVAAMTAPVLFLIAEDLTQMELQVKVDEADVGTVKLGQPASFTVAAWPGRIFPATIRRVGVGSTITDNVVTYKTLLAVANDDLALRPGMTATARITTGTRENVLLVPNAALRFTPPVVGAAASAPGLVDKLLPRPPQQRKQKTQNGASPATQVWVLQAGRAVAVPVRTGLSNGRMTEIVEGDLKAGAAVITEYRDAAK
jgi:HlyD family secretion protein